MSLTTATDSPASILAGLRELRTAADSNTNLRVRRGPLTVRYTDADAL